MIAEGELPVEVPDNPTRINVSIDRSLLKRVDDAAEPTHRRRQQKAQQDSKGDRDNDVASKIQERDNQPDGQKGQYAPRSRTKLRSVVAIP
jgi:hypothetical protein